jgi:hypothetical protein
MKKFTTMIAVGLVSVAGLASALHVSTSASNVFLNAPDKHFVLPVKKEKAGRHELVAGVAQVKPKDNSTADLVALTCRCNTWRYEEAQRRWVLDLI